MYSSSATVKRFGGSPLSCAYHYYVVPYVTIMQSACILLKIYAVSSPLPASLWGKRSRSCPPHYSFTLLLKYSYFLDRKNCGWSRPDLHPLAPQTDIREIEKSGKLLAGPVYGNRSKEIENCTITYPVPGFCSKFGFLLLFFPPPLGLKLGC